MYEDFYGFSEQPFNLTPDPKYLYLTPTHSAAFSSMRSGIRERKGITVITGDVGTGKTTLIRALLMDLDETVKTAHIFRTNFDFRDLLTSILYELNVPEKREDAFALLEKFYQYLSERRQDKIVAIIIDEAQNLETDVLKDLLGLWTRPNPRSQLVQTILTGQLEFEAKLNSEGLRDFRERIAVRSRIIPLTRNESRAYINHRLKIVGSSSSKVFESEAVDRICDFAGAIPRIINTVCDAAFLIGYAKSKQKIDFKSVREAIRDLGYPQPAQADKRRQAEPLSEPSEALIETIPKRVQRPVEPSSERAQPEKARRVKPLYGILVGSVLVALALGVFALVTWDRTSSKEIHKTAALEERRTEVKSAETVVAEKGSTLSLLAKRYYGVVNPTVLDRILEANPQINDVHLIRAGRRIELPLISKESLLIQSSEKTYKILLGTFQAIPAIGTFKNQPALQGKTIESVPRRVSPRETWYRMLAGTFETKEEGLKSLRALRAKGLVPALGASARSV